MRPCDKLKEHAEKLLAINGLREQLRYYNDNICSLSFAYTRAAAGYPSRSGLRSMGQDEGDKEGMGEVFFRLESASEQDRKIYLEERQRETDRLQNAVNAAPAYPEKLKALVENRAGQLVTDADSLRVLTNHFQLYLVGLKEIAPRNREYIIDLYPSGYDKNINAGLNKYLYDHVKAVQDNPDKYHWLCKPDYKKFDREGHLKELKGNMDRAFDKNATLRNRLKELEQRYRLNSFVNYKGSLYENWSADGFLSPFLGGDIWKAAIFNAFYNGERYNFSRRVLRLNNIIDLIYVEDEYDFYVELRRKESANTLESGKDGSPNKGLKGLFQDPKKFNLVIDRLKDKEIVREEANGFVWLGMRKKAKYEAITLFEALKSLKLINRRAYTYSEIQKILSETFLDQATLDNFSVSERIIGDVKIYKKKQEYESILSGI